MASSEAAFEIKRLKEELEQEKQTSKTAGLALEEATSEIYRLKEELKYERQISKSTPEITLLEAKFKKNKEGRIGNRITQQGTQLGFNPQNFYHNGDLDL